MRKTSIVVILVATGLVVSATLYLATLNQEIETGPVAALSDFEAEDIVQRPGALARREQESAVVGADEYRRVRSLPQIEYLDHPLSDVFHSLVRQAEDGDVLAMRALHLELHECEYAIRYAEYLERNVAHTATEELNIELRRVERGLRICEGIPEFEIDRARHWLVRAADAGDHYSQLLYAARMGELLSDSQYLLENPNFLSEFKANAAKYMHSAAQSCLVEAMGQLGVWYANGGVVEQDPKMAYMYAYTASLAGASQFGTSPDSSYMESLRRDLTIRQLDAANRLAMSYLSRNCK